MRSIAAAVVVVVVVVMQAVMVTKAEMAAAKEVPLVDAEEGRVSGILEKSMKGREFFSFYGIPFAQPPVGKLRFKDPEAPSPWEGTRDAATPPAVCPQADFQESPDGSQKVVGDEDCLYLNVFTPTETRDGGLPVMVWIHGGGFFSGSAQQYGPHVLMNQDLVLVVVQYRLGVLGFLSTEDSVMPGNLGLKDQTMALQWVKRNIHHFGGDNTRITIFGESAGGASVHYQILTPKSEGLFNRAILQSGAALCPWTVNTSPQKAALRLAGIVGCPTDQGSQALLTCLQGLDAAVIAPVYRDFLEWHMLPFTFTPWVDGDYLPEDPARLALEGRHAQVDIIAGITRDEGALFAAPFVQNKSLQQKLQNSFSEAGPVSLTLSGLCKDPVAVARQLYHYYSGTTHVTEAHAESLSRMFGDRHFAVCHDLTTALHAAHLHPTKKTFRYEVQHRGELSLVKFFCPSCAQDWVSHGDDIFYLFDFGFLPGFVNQQKPDDLSLRDIIVTLWTNFATTGDPTPDDSLGFKWEPSTQDNLQFLSLTPSPSMQPDNRKEARKFHNSLPTTLNLLLHPHLVEDGTRGSQVAEHQAKTEL